MYSEAFCKIYNLFGWNYFPEAFGEQLLQWMKQENAIIRSSLDIGCGTGILCEILHKNGIDARGMDLSEGMIEIARENNPEIPYETGNMITYRPDCKYDLVTCTGDALNHIMDLQDVDRIFDNVSSYTNPGGYFIFDVLNEKEVGSDEPFELDFSETVHATFQITKDTSGLITLHTDVYENGERTVEERIHETLHDPLVICDLLRKNGFQVLSCADSLLKNPENHGTTWFIVARKEDK